MSSAGKDSRGARSSSTPGTSRPTRRCAIPAVPSSGCSSAASRRRRRSTRYVGRSSELKVGETGYVYVLGGQGKHRGQYIVSRGGSRDGEDIWEAKDAAGTCSSRRSSWMPWRRNRAPSPTEDTRGRTKQSPGAPQERIAAVTYFQPWDWVIGTTIYQKEFNQAAVVAGGAGTVGADFHGGRRDRIRDHPGDQHPVRAQAPPEAARGDRHGRGPAGGR